MKSSRIARGAAEADADADRRHAQTKVARAALQNAASIASLLLTTEALITGRLSDRGLSHAP